MATDHIRYDLLAQEALRGVVRTVLADAAKNGLPGDHHFKITFLTAMPGVRLSERMRAQYPEVMTVILQHQFWNLAVHDDAFEVGLSFGGVPEKLVVPFAAVSAFFDPAVQFGFQFEAIESASAEGGDAAVEGAPSATAGSPRLAETKMSGGLPAPEAAEDAGDDGADDKGAGAQVVRLDRFRKK